MIRDFDFVPRPHKRNAAEPIQPAPAQRPLSSFRVPALPKSAIHIPKPNILDLRNVRPIPRIKPKVKPSESTLRNFHPLKFRKPQVQPVVHQSASVMPTQQMQQFAPSRSMPVRSTQQYPQTVPTEQVLEMPAPQPLSEYNHPKQKKNGIFSRKNILGAVLSLVGIIIVAGGLLTPLLQNPHLIVALYIPIALIFKLKSQTSFTLALLLLISIPVLIVLKQQALAETYAVLCFYFLVVGVVMAAFELRTGGRRIHT